MTSQPLAGRHALVTGAGRGIGAAIAERLIQEGARVTLLGRQLATLEATARKLGDATQIVTGDVSDAEQMRAAVARACEHFGALDILINNAGQCTATMDGWLSRAAARASRRVRSRRSARSASGRFQPSRTSLIATSRWSSSSLARQTTPIPPSPSRSSVR